MDRFIESNAINSDIARLSLKSNMDRFIEIEHHLPILPIQSLKSNMDRFIGFSFTPLSFCHWSFKIQYG